MQVQALSVPEPGTSIACGFYVQQDDTRELVLIRGRVVWTRHRAGCFGVRFTNLSVDPSRLMQMLVGDPDTARAQT